MRYDKYQKFQARQEKYRRRQFKRRGCGCFSPLVLILILLLAATGMEMIEIRLGEGDLDESN